jgi:hypothetical protein
MRKGFRQPSPTSGKRSLSRAAVAQLGTQASVEVIAERFKGARIGLAVRIFPAAFREEPPDSRPECTRFHPIDGHDPKWVQQSKEIRGDRTESRRNIGAGEGNRTLVVSLGKGDKAFLGQQRTTMNSYISMD